MLGNELVLIPWNLSEDLVEPIPEMAAGKQIHAHKRLVSVFCAQLDAEQNIASWT
jgi:hypothetical protein